MNAQICHDGRSIKYSSILLQIKLWAIDEILPLSCLVTMIFCLTFLVSHIVIIPYTCLKWRAAIWFWLTYFLWTVYDSETLNGKGRNVVFIGSGPLFNMWLPVFPLVKKGDSIGIIQTRQHVFQPGNRRHAIPCISTGVRSQIKIARENANVLFELFITSGSIASNTVHYSTVYEGFCDSKLENLLKLLKSEPAKAVVIFPGGNKEARLSRSGNIYRIIKNRKGFIKLALQTGSPLVPVFSFGEQNTMDNIHCESPIFSFVNGLFYKYSRTELAFPIGRGYSLIPRRLPITTVVGKPIEVPKVEDPSAELVDKYHEKFYKALQDLFDKYEHEYGKGDAAQLIMICD